MLVGFGANAPRPVLYQVNSAYGDLTRTKVFPNRMHAEAREQTRFDVEAREKTAREEQKKNATKGVHETKQMPSAEKLLEAKKYASPLAIAAAIGIAVYLIAPETNEYTLVAVAFTLFVFGVIGAVSTFGVRSIKKHAVISAVAALVGIALVYVITPEMNEETFLIMAIPFIVFNGIGALPTFGGRPMKKHAVISAVAALIGIAFGYWSKPEDSDGGGIFVLTIFAVIVFNGIDVLLRFVVPRPRPD
jgi:uncharacterized membrane protein HdeD (DUF308 family)